MKNLLLMRHAKSSWKFAELADHDRPLSKRGKRDAPRMGEFLREQGLIPDLIISSTAKRARKTAQAVAEQMESGVALQLVRELYFGTAQSWLQLLQSCDPSVESVLLVGHNPGMEQFLESLTCDYESLPTAAVAWVELPIESWGELSEHIAARLVHVWRPKELPR